MKEKLEKMFLGTDEDFELANEIIKAHMPDFKPTSFLHISGLDREFMEGKYWLMKTGNKWTRVVIPWR